MIKEKFYQWLKMALVVLLILAIGLTFYISAHYVMGYIKDEARQTPCETGEGITAGMPCPEMGEGPNEH